MLAPGVTGAEQGVDAGGLAGLVVAFGEVGGVERGLGVQLGGLLQLAVAFGPEADATSTPPTVSSRKSREIS